MIVFVLVGVAYLTMLERKILEKDLTRLGFWAYYNHLEMVLNCWVRKEEHWFLNLIIIFIIFVQWYWLYL